MFSEPDYVPIDEAHPNNRPVNPKWMVEQTLADYIHIVDLFSAHLLALKHLISGGAGEYFNLGNG